VLHVQHIPQRLVQHNKLTSQVACVMMAIIHLEVAVKRNVYYATPIIIVCRVMNYNVQIQPLVVLVHPPIVIVYVHLVTLHYLDPQYNTTLLV
jgi:hypothetical protein